MAFEVGQIVSDYEIVDVLGKGGMGRVYRVRNVISQRIEAMKVLLADLAAEPELGDRFGGEIRTLAKLDHPNIAKLHTAFKAENQLVMIMEFVEGFTLTDRARQGPIPVDELLSYIGQTLSALGYAHKEGIIHRDVKPSNIMVTPHGVVKLMDFGIAKSNTEAMHTRAGTTMGSMLYMSPEQVRGMSVDGRSDLYSLGVVLYELAAGRRPFEAENTYAVLDAQLNAKPPFPIEVNPSIPKPLNDIIMTALEKEPMRRFQTADAFRKALESLKTNAATPEVKVAPPVAVSASAPGNSGAKNRGLWMALGAVACVLILIAAAVALPHVWQSRAASKAGGTIDQAVSKPLAPPLVTPAPAPVTVAPSDTKPANEMVNAVNEPVHQPTTIASAHTTPRVPAPQPSTKTDVSPAQVPSPQPPQTQTAQNPPPVQGPSQEEIDKVQDNLVQVHARADSVRASVNNLRRQQAADGLEISPEISGAASRLDNYLQAADRAAQANDLSAAHRNLDNAEKQLTFLEAKFGR